MILEYSNSTFQDFISMNKIYIKIHIDLNIIYQYTSTIQYLIIDLVFVLNTVFDVVIVGMGYWAYRKSGNKIPAYIGIAFGIFIIANLITVLGYAETLGTVLLIIRSLAYLIFIFALYKFTSKRSNAKP